MQSEASSYTYASLMDSFPVYLPSNACPHIYPNNTLSDYHTRIDQTINLDGEWVVGVESICYSSHIDDESNKAQIDCDLTVWKEQPVNDYEAYKFKLNQHGKWKGLAGVIPTQFEEDPNNTEGVMKTLNDMNSQIFKEEKTGFTFKEGAYTKAPELVDFALRLSPRLAQVLGYPSNVLSGKGDVLAFKQYRKVGEKKLRAKDYLLKYFHTDVQKRVERFELLPKNYHFDGKESTLLKLWNEKIHHVTDVVIRFSNNKLIIDNYRADFVILFSPELGKATGHERPIIGRGTTWASRKANLSEGVVSESWCIEIFSTDLRLLEREVEESHLTVDIYPWQYETMEKAMEGINQNMKNAVQRKLNTLYSAQHHHFHLSLVQGGFVSLAMGDWIKIQFSKNIAHLFGMSGDVLQHLEVMSMRRVGTLKNRERPLFLLSNIAKTTAYGNQHLQILQNFLHKPGEKAFIDQHFHPVMYVPLLHNTIDMIHIQLTTEDGKSIKIADSETLVTLKFKKVREKTMM